MEPLLVVSGAVVVSVGDVLVDRVISVEDCCGMKDELLTDVVIVVLFWERERVYAPTPTTTRMTTTTITNTIRPKAFRVFKKNYYEKVEFLEGIYVEPMVEGLISEVKSRMNVNQRSTKCC